MGKGLWPVGFWGGEPQAKEARGKVGGDMPDGLVTQEKAASVLGCRGQEGDTLNVCGVWWKVRSPRGWEPSLLTDHWFTHH